MILHGRTGENDAMGGLQPHHYRRGLGLPVLDNMSLIEAYGVPLFGAEHFILCNKQSVGGQDNIAGCSLLDHTFTIGSRVKHLDMQRGSKALQLALPIKYH